MVPFSNFDVCALSHVLFEADLPLLGHIKWSHTKVLHFFNFFWISYAWFGTRMKWRRQKTSACSQEVRSPALTVKVPWKNDVLWIRNDFFQKSGACLVYRYSTNPPRFHRNRQELAQNPKYTSKGLRDKIADIRIPGFLLFMWGVVPTFRFRFR
jgi:hypothetical protein